MFYDCIKTSILLSFLATNSNSYSQDNILNGHVSKIIGQRLDIEIGAEEYLCLNVGRKFDFY